MVIKVDARIGPIRRRHDHKIVRDRYPAILSREVCTPDLRDIARHLPNVRLRILLNLVHNLHQTAVHHSEQRILIFSIVRGEAEIQEIAKVKTRRIRLATVSAYVFVFIEATEGCLATEGERFDGFQTDEG